MREFKLFVIVAAIAVIAACSQSASNTTVTTNSAAPNSNAGHVVNAPATPAATTEVASGADLYKTSCSKCHRDDGTGGKITIEGKQIDPDDLTTAKINSKPDEKLVKYINEGFPEDGMPSFKGKLKDDEIAAIIKYIRTSLNKSGATPVPPANK